MMLKRGDTVLVTYGKDKGKKGKILKVIDKHPEEASKILIEGINIAKKAVRPSKKFSQGGIITKEMPLFSSKAMLVCPVCGQPARVGKRTLENGKNVRYCKKCNELIDKV